MVGRRYDHKRTDLVPITPDRKHLALAVGTSGCPWDLDDVPYAEHAELADLTGRLIFVGESAADELVIDPARRVGEHSDSRRDTALNEVSSLEHPSAPRIKGDDDGVGGRDRFLDDERPSYGPQYRFTGGGNTDDDGREQRNYCRSAGPPWPSKARARIHVHVAPGHSMKHGHQKS